MNKIDQNNLTPVPSASGYFYVTHRFARGLVTGSCYATKADVVEHHRVGVYYVRIKKKN